MADKGNFSILSNPQYLAQVGHLLGGVSVIVTAAMFSIATRSGWEPTLVTFAVGVVLASFKEFAFDTSALGEGDSWADSWMDWAFYMLGGGVGMGLAAWAYHLAA